MHTRIFGPFNHLQGYFLTFLCVWVSLDYTNLVLLWDLLELIQVGFQVTSVMLGWLQIQIQPDHLRSSTLYFQLFMLKKQKRRRISMHRWFSSINLYNYESVYMCTGLILPTNACKHSPSQSFSHKKLIFTFGILNNWQKFSNFRIKLASVLNGI